MRAISVAGRVRIFRHLRAPSSGTGRVDVAACLAEPAARDAGTRGNMGAIEFRERQAMISSAQRVQAGRGNALSGPWTASLLLASLLAYSGAVSAAPKTDVVDPDQWRPHHRRSEIPGVQPAEAQHLAHGHDLHRVGQDREPAVQTSTCCSNAPTAPATTASWSQGDDDSTLQVARSVDEPAVAVDMADVVRAEPIEGGASSTGSMDTSARASTLRRRATGAVSILRAGSPHARGSGNGPLTAP